MEGNQHLLQQMIDPQRLIGLQGLPGEASVRHFLERTANVPLENQTFAHNTIRNVSIVKSSENSLFFEIPVEQMHLNGLGSVHGGFYAFAADILTSLTILAIGGKELGGISLQLDVRYLGTCSLGDTIEMECTVEKHKGKVLFTSANFRSLQTGRLLASATHTKYRASL